MKQGDVVRCVQAVHTAFEQYEAKGCVEERLCRDMVRKLARDYEDEILAALKGVV